MNYSEFLLIFLLPWVVLELFLLLRRNDPVKIVLVGVLLVASLMVVAAAPFLNFLAREGEIVFNQDLSFALIEAVPLEICLLVVGATFFSGLLLYFFRPRIHRKRTPAKMIKFAGCLFYFTLGALGAIMLDMKITRHLGMVLVWASPFLFVGWLIGGGVIWRTKNMFGSAALLSAAYFTLIEGFALSKELWSVRYETSLGVALVNVPLERAVFYILFSLILCQALEIFWYFYQRPHLLVNGHEEKDE